jgi:molybdopterin converting factor small subunit/predicted transport protein
MNWVFPLLSFAGALVGAWVFSFLREKGKNFATKSDVGKITETVESIKSNYNKEQETLRAQLNMLVNAQNSLHVDMKRAIYEFWDSVMLLRSLCDTTRPELDEERIADLAHYKREIERVEYELQMKHVRLYLLVEDQQLLDLSEKLYDDVSKYQGRFGLYLIEAQPCLEKLANMYRQPNLDKIIYDEYWQKLLSLDKKFEKEVEDLYDPLEKNADGFKKRSHELLSNTKKII